MCHHFVTMAHFLSKRPLPNRVSNEFTKLNSKYFLLLKKKSTLRGEAFIKTFCRLKQKYCKTLRAIFHGGSPNFLSNNRSTHDAYTLGSIYFLDF